MTEPQPGTRRAVLIGGWLAILLMIPVGVFASVTIGSDLSTRGEAMDGFEAFVGFLILGVALVAGGLAGAGLWVRDRAGTAAALLVIGSWVVVGGMVLIFVPFLVVL